MFSMLNRRKTLYIVLSFVLSIAFGIWYNNTMGHYLPIYITTVMIVTYGSVFALFTVSKVFEIDFINNAKMSKIFFWVYTLLVGVGSIVWFLYCNSHQSFVIMNFVYIVLMYPLAFKYTKQNVQNSDSVIVGVLEQTLVVIATTLIAYFIGQYKLALFTFGMVFIAEVIALKTSAMTKKRAWKIHLLILLVSSLVGFCWLTTYLPSVVERMRGFIAPKYYPEYSFLIDVLKNFEWIDYFTKNDFIYNIHSAFACPYAHVLYMLGLLPTLVLVIIQVLMIVFMVKRSLEFQNDNRKFLGIMSGIVVGLHFLLSFGSSTLRAPICEWGASFFTIKGLEYCIFPLFLFFFLEIQEREITIKGLWEMLKDLVGLGIDDFETLEDDMEFNENSDKEYTLFKDRCMIFEMIKLLDNPAEVEEISSLIKEICKDASNLISSHYNNNVSFDRKDLYNSNLKKMDALCKERLHLNPEFYTADDDRLLGVSAMILNWMIN